MRSEDRQKIILNTLVTDYIDRGEAISSQSLVGKTRLDISSATMRNDLTSLEQEGFVKQLHTSSGRIPTDKGYRYFVDNIGEILQSEKELAFFEQQLSQVSTRIDKLLFFSAQVLSEISEYPVIVMTESLQRNIVKFIQLILLNVHQVLIVVLNNYGENFEEIIGLEEPNISQDALNKITEYLNNSLKDIPVDNLGEIFGNNIEEVSRIFSSYENIFNKIIIAIKKSPKALSSRNLHIEKNNQLLSFPEFQDIETLKKIHSVLEDEHKIYKMFHNKTTTREQDQIVSCIGMEHSLEELASTSLIFSPVMVHGEEIANIGMLGPTRMKYGKIMSRMNSLMCVLCKKIEHLFM